MDTHDIDNFWREKEKECHSTLVKASFARYITGYPMLQGPITGLLYIMKNGIYFENFEKDHWVDKVFRVKIDFTPVLFCLENRYITEVSCYPGQKNKFRIPLRKRLSAVLGLLPQHLLVNYIIDGNPCIIRFACAESLLSLCTAYYRDCKTTTVLEKK